MKQLFLLPALFLISLTALKSQITLENTYQSSNLNQAAEFFLTKFSNAGYKYVTIERTPAQIKIYNLNHSLNTTINIPGIITGNYGVLYISDNLFDLDNNIEYAVSVDVDANGAYPKVYIFKDNGTQMFFRDSSYIYESRQDIFKNYSGVFYNGISAKMAVFKYGANLGAGPMGWEIYNLPGMIPCLSCMSGPGTVTSIINQKTDKDQETIFYPNPVNDQLKLKYEIPKDAKTAEIKITDLQGKSIENYKIDRTFDHLYLPSDFNNGMYLYSLYVDDKLIKTEKVILTK